MIYLDNASPVDWSSSLNRDLVCWFLGGVPGRTGGVVWYDLVKRRKGTLTNMNPKADWQGTNRRGGYGVLRFAGTDDWVTTPEIFGSVTNLTVCCWVKYTTTTTQQFVGQYNSSVNQRAFFLGCNTAASGKLDVIVSTDGGGTNVKDYRSATAINSGTWRHVAFTFSPNALLLYIDGVVEASPTKATDATVNSIFDSTAAITMGASNNGATNFYTGLLDDVRIWTRTLSASAIYKYYELSQRGYGGLINTLRKVPAMYQASTFSPAWAAHANTVIYGVPAA